MEKRLFHIYNPEKDEDNYLRLTDNEVAFLDWLNEKGYLDSDTYFDAIGALPTPIEF